MSSDEMVPTGDNGSDGKDDNGHDELATTPAAAIEQTIGQILAHPFAEGRKWFAQIWSAAKLLGTWTFWFMVFLLAFCFGLLYGSVGQNEFIRASFLALPVICTLVILTRVMWKISFPAGVATVIMATVYGVGLMANVMTENQVDNPIATSQNLWRMATGQVGQISDGRKDGQISELESRLADSEYRRKELAAYVKDLQAELPCPDRPQVHPVTGPIKAMICIDGYPHKWCAVFEDSQVGAEPMDLGYLATEGWASDGYAIVTVVGPNDWTEIGRIQQGARVLERNERSHWVQLKRYP